MNRCCLVVLILLGTIMGGCSNYVDPLAEISEVKVVLDRFYLAQQREDMTALSALFAQDDDIVVFGTEQGERYVGLESIKAMYQRQMDLVEGVQTDLSEQIIKVSRGGTAAWVSSLNHASGQKGEDRVEMDYRSTAVLEKRDGKWLIVHIHNSQPQMQKESQ